MTGNTTCLLYTSGYDVVVLDNLSNASEKSLERVSKITGKPVKFYKADILEMCIRDRFNIMKILVWYYWRSRSESAFIDVIYSVGVIPEIFLNCLEK